MGRAEKLIPSWLIGGEGWVEVQCGSFVIPQEVIQRKYSSSKSFALSYCRTFLKSGTTL